MAYNAYAIGLIGIRHPAGYIRDKLYVERHVRGCPHPIDKSAKFCPECGEAAHKLLYRPINEYDVDSEELFQYKLVHRGAGHYGNPEYIAYWCSGLVAPQDDAFLEMKEAQELDFCHIKNKMQLKLEPLGLFDPSTFGIHVLLYESS